MGSHRSYSMSGHTVMVGYCTFCTGYATVSMVVRMGSRRQFSKEEAMKNPPQTVK